MQTENYERYNELYDKAVSRYLDKTDFDVTEWLNNDEADEYIKLQDEVENG